MKLEIEINPAAFAAIDKLPALLKFKVLDKCLPKMAKPIVERAKQLAPSSRRSGSRKKWGKKYKLGDNGENESYQNDSGKAMTYKIFRASFGAVLYVGGKYPQANKLNFLAVKSGKRRLKYWGRDPKHGPTTKTTERPTFLQKAYDQTKSQAMAAFVAEFEKQIKELKLG